MIRMTGMIRVLGIVAAVLLWTAGSANAGDVPMPAPAKAFKGDKCVEPQDVMRREHMNFLKHQRDDTLREGIRGAKYSLKECVDCHAVASPKVADGKIRTLKPFCAECHAYAAVSIDCFACHTGAADDEKTSGATMPDDKTHTLLSALKTHLQTGEVKQ